MVMPGDNANLIVELNDPAVRTHTHTRSYIYTHIYTNTHTHTRSYIYTHIYTNTRTLTYTHR
jgi:hypothetical protein